MKYLFIPLLFWSLVCDANTNVVDLLVDMEAGNPGDLVTSNLLATASHTNGNIGYWLVSTNSILTFTNSRNAAPRGPVIVNGTAYTGSGDTHSIACDNSQNLNRQYATFTFAADHDKLSCGYAFRWTSGGTFNLFDTFALEGANGSEFCVASVEDRTAGSSRISIETQGCTSGGGYKTFSDDNYYWISMLWDKANLTAKLAVYDMSTWRSLFWTNCSIASTACRKLYLGRYDAHQNGASAIMYYDNIIVDLAGTTWPLLPKGATINAQSTSRVAFDEAYTNAVDAAGDNRIRDTILFPAPSSNAWTSGYTVNKTLIISGSSSNADTSIGSIVAASGFASQDRLFSVLANFVTMSNLHVTATAGDITNPWLIVNEGKDEVLRDIHFSFGLASTIAYNRGVCYNCSFFNTVRMGRWFNLHGGQDNIDAGYVTPYDITMFGTTNFFCWENNKMSNNSYVPTQVVISGQDGGMGVARFNDIRANATGWDPVFDVHGAIAATEYSDLAIQIYKNTVTITGGGAVGRFVDQRGGSLMCYSNDINVACTDDLRIAAQNSAFYHVPGKEVTNSWHFNNTQAGANMPPNVLNPADIQLHVHYESTAPTILYATPYPNPLRHDAAAQGGGGTPAGSVGTRRISRIRVTR